MLGRKFAIASAAEHDEAVGGNRDLCRRRHVIPRLPIRSDAPAVSSGVLVRHLIVEIAVKGFAPPIGTWEAEPVAETIELLQIKHKQHVFAHSIDPTVDCHHTTEAVGGRDAQLFAPQRSVTAPQANQILYATQWCGGLCGEGLWVALALEEGQWKRLKWGSVYSIS